MHRQWRARPWWLLARAAGCAIVLLIVALGCAACEVPTSSALAPVSLVSLHAPQRLPTSAWEQVALPAAAADMRGFVAAPTNAAQLFACSAQPMAYWRSTDAGAHWTRYPLTLGPQDQCSFSIAPDDPGRVTLQVQRSAQDGPFCASDVFYLSGNGGVTWRKLAPHISIAPTNVSYGWCDLHVTRRHLYLAYSYEPPEHAPQVSLLERSDDDGASWVHADRGLGGGTLFSMPAIGPGETLTMTVMHYPNTTDTGLWTSTDAGDTWRQTSAMPDGVGTFLWTLPPRGNTWPTASQPFYALENEQLPSGLYRERVVMSADGHNWMLLPPLLVVGASESRAGILQALDVLPDGRLAVWGADPKAGLPAEDTTGHWQVSSFSLWLWDPVAQTWQAIPSPLGAPASEGCGLCWQGQAAASRDGAAYIYVSRFWEGLTGG
ncbi:MAG TPA: sialidase family protein, partial [Ktedonobacterales bacterium]|nr:sialidase family protein [Ktedonobacterales bacterium]